jgi:hypothetical protein
MEEVLSQFEQYTKTERVRKGLIFWLALIFIFLFQEFFYVKDNNILYILSKVVIGVLSLIVFVVYFLKILVTKRLPEYSWYLVFIFLFLVIISATSSYYYFHQPYIMGIVAQIKLTGVFYYFFMFAILRGFNVTLRELELTFFCVGMFFLITYITIDLSFNPQKYWTQESDIIVHDSKGYRFRWPDVFITILTFYTFRKMVANFNLIRLSVFLLTYGYVLVLSGERLYLCCVTAVLGITIFFKSNASIKIFLLGLSVVIIVWLVNGGFDFIAENVNTASLDTRLVTTTNASKFISAQFDHLLFGGGNLNELWLNGFARIYGNSFFLSDIGWVGICYEFGLIGALVCLSLYIVLFIDVKKTLRPGKTILMLTLRDYLLFRLLESSLSPGIPYYIGIFTSILAISVFVRYYIRPYKVAAL